MKNKYFAHTSSFIVSDFFFFLNIFIINTDVASIVSTCLTEETLGGDVCVHSTHKHNEHDLNEPLSSNPACRVEVCF